MKDLREYLENELSQEFLKDKRLYKALTNSYNFNMLKYWADLAFTYNPEQLEHLKKTWFKENEVIVQNR